MIEDEGIEEGERVQGQGRGWVLVPWREKVREAVAEQQKGGGKQIGGRLRASSTSEMDSGS